MNFILGLKEELKKISQKLFEQGITKDSIHNYFPISGGSVNHSFGMVSGRDRLFVKLNKKTEFTNMFKKEVLGLKQLNRTMLIKTPKIIFEGEIENIAFLVLEMIEEGKKNKQFWESFGIGLAEIHKYSNQNFGLEYDNYNGSLVQKNTNTTNWNDFFIENRLQFQLKLAF